MRSSKQIYTTSDHYDGRRFHNLNPGTRRKSFFQALKWKIEGGKQPWPKEEQIKEAPTFPTSIREDEVFVTFIGHATVLIQFKGLTILTDPVFSSLVGPLSIVGVKRSTLLKITIEELPKVDVVLISHNHYDHFDLPSIRKIWHTFQPLFIVPLKNSSTLKNLGIHKVVELDWWESYSLSKGKSITLTPAQHWSGRTFLDHYKTLWGSFVVSHENLKFFSAGIPAMPLILRKSQSDLELWM